MGVCFVLAKKPIKDMAKKVEVQEKRRVEGLMKTFSFSHSFYKQNETTIISKKYK